MNWIKVSERKPEATVGAEGHEPIISDDVLLFWPGALDCNYDIGNFDHEEGTWNLVNHGYEQPDAEPTHWMPIPVAPHD